MLLTQPLPKAKESERLESVWAGDFGNAYTERNKDWLYRRPFWRDIVKETQPASVLEVGCNIGHNLMCLNTKDRELYGVDINKSAIEAARSRIPSALLSVNRAQSLPWKTNRFDLVFTMGVLIHQPDETIESVMSEIVRCAKKWVLCAEYHSDVAVDVPYRGIPGSLFKRNYKDMYLKFPLELHSEGFLCKDDWFDNLTWHLFKKVTP
jgi:pseudaminic acid biosynthesis-associated methylase